MKRFRKLVALALIAASVPMSAQTKDGKANSVPVKRVPPAQPSPKEAVPSPDKYPFGQLIDSLGSQPDPASPSPAPAAPASAVRSGLEVPADFRPSKEVALPASAQSALVVAKGWMAEKQAPAPGADGRVLYTYGAGMPTVVCAPMRVCVVELETGEHLSGEPHVGDSVR